MQVVTGNDIAREVLALIEGSKQVLFLASPYFDPWDRLTTEIKRAATRPGMKVVLLLRGGEDRAKQEAKARDLESVGVGVEFLARLHAKIYISESQAIVTSMNLLKSSALDSWEIAMRVDAKQDAVQFAQIVEYAKQLRQRAKDEVEITGKQQAAANVASVLAMAETVIATLASPKVVAAPKAAAARGRVRTGHCIRCGDGVLFAVERPLCPECFKSWAKYANPEYKEKFCHGCGKERATSVAKPLCKPCWEAEA